MHKFFKTIVFILLLILSLQQVAFASEGAKSPKPTEGVESTDPIHGSSSDPTTVSVQSSIVYNYYCSIDNTGTDLYLEGVTSANYISDIVSVTIYLQKWDGSQWIDTQSWSFSQTNVRSITEGVRASYQKGNYYRTKAVHYVKYGAQTETQTSTSSYIYID